MSPPPSIWTAQRLAIALAASVILAGCDARNAMERHADIEDPWVQNQPYPRLVDSPQTPPPGEFNAATPDPARGQAIIEELGPVAQEMAILGAAVSGQQVLDPEFENQMRERGALPPPEDASASAL